MILLLLKAFAVYRLARLIAIDNGPFDCFLLIRQVFGKVAARYKFFRTFADGVNCQYCLGFWFALVAALVLPGEYPWWIVWLALAGIQAFLVELVDAIYER